MEEKTQSAPKRENVWISLLCNLAIPLLILKQGDRLFDGRPGIALAVALAFPVGYGVRDFFRRRKVNLISALGFVSVLLTGGVGLLDLPRRWIVVKEAAIPGVIGLAALASLKTKKPLVRAFLYNPQIFNVPKIQARLAERDTIMAFERLLRRCTWIIALSFFLSAALNYVVADHFIQTEPSVDKAQFNKEVGDMMLWSYVIIFVPSISVMFVALWQLLSGMKACAGLSFEEALSPELAPPEPEKQQQ